MLNLEPLIARLVEDVLRAIGDATLAELDGLAAPTATAREARPPASSPAARSRARRGDGRRQASGRSARRAPAATRGKAVASAREDQAPVAAPHGQDITDPERLLASLAPSPPARRVHRVSPLLEDEAVASPDVGSPPPARVPESPVARLRAGESLARVSGAGVVIRRARRS